MEVIIITGPPYSGKGTQCDYLKKRTNFDHISTGDRCRLEKKNGTPIGLIMSEYEENGNLVPDSVIKDLFTKILKGCESRGVILDGYPRTVCQVDDLIEITSELNLEIKLVINICVPRNELLKRAEIRMKSSDRKDDRIEIHSKRIEIFENSTLPAIEYFRSKINVIDVDGVGTLDEVSSRIGHILSGPDVQ